MSTKKTTKTNKKTNKKNNAKASKPKAVPAAKPEPKAVDENTKAKTDRLVARREYARTYYQANREKLVAASAKSHAKRNASLRNQAAVLARVYDALCGVVSEHGVELFDRFAAAGGAAMMNDIENALNG